MCQILYACEVDLPGIQKTSGNLFCKMFFLVIDCKIWSLKRYSAISDYSCAGRMKRCIECDSVFTPGSAYTLITMISTTIQYNYIVIAAT